MLAATRVYGLLVQLELENKIYTNTKLVKNGIKKSLIRKKNMIGVSNNTLPE